jgi:nucleotide-binding universal stress UspA family protein
MIRLQEILVPVDFSTASDSALNYAQALAETFHARLHVLHVLEDWVLYGGLDPAPPEVRVELERSSRENMAKMLSAEAVRALRAEMVLKVGSPFVEIVRYAKDQSIDLVVLGTHGHGPIAHMLMGSVAERVVRKAPCPVLTVRHPEHEFVMP